VEINQSLKIGNTYFDINDIVLVKTGDKYSAGLGGSVTIDMPKYSYQGRLSSIKTGIIEVDSSTELHSNVHKIRIGDILEMQLISKFNKEEI
jgi:hypothetical protein